MESQPIIPAQIRAARGLLGISQEELALAADVGVNSVRDIEGQRRSDGVGAIKEIVRVLENEGITFVAGDQQLGPGVRLGAHLPNIIVRPTRIVDGVLPFTVEWRGRRVIVCVAREPLEDLERANYGLNAHEQFVKAFDKNRRIVLEAAARAMDETGRITRDGRVYLTEEDIAQHQGRRRRS